MPLIYQGAGDEFRVNTTTIGDQRLSRLTCLVGGGFVITWPTTASDGDSRAQLFNAAGAPVGGEFLIAASATGTNGSPQVTALAGGGFLATWTGTSSTGLSNIVTGQIFGAAAQRVGSEFAVTPPPSGSDFPQMYEITATPSGGFIVVWGRFRSGISWQEFSAAGAKTGDQHAIDIQGRELAEPVLVVLAGGGYAVAYLDRPMNPPIEEFRPETFTVRTYDANWNLITTVGFHVYSVNPNGVGVTWDMVALAGGGFAVTDGVRARIYDAAGSAVGGEIDVSNNGVAIANPAMVAMPGGGFAIAGRQGEIVLMVLDAQGDIVQWPTTANTITAGVQDNPDLGLAANGDLVISWGSQIGASYEIEARRLALAPEPSAIDGTPGNDVLNGTDAAESIYGLDGDDVLYGNGADPVYGYGSSDTLYGGDGNDTLYGDSAATRTSDVLIGGDGDDIYYVDPSDRVVEATGGGFDTVLIGESYTLTAGAKVEVLSTIDRTGTAAIDLIGNALNQTIYGNAGVNALEGGGGGGDTLVGLGGNDFYRVDTGDAVIEAAGGGHDNVLARSDYVLTAGQHVELLSTSFHGGDAPIDLTGNELGQVIIGNNGSNILIGGGGADYLQGLQGNDVYYVDRDDRVIEDESGSYDNVLALESYTLNAGAAVEILSTSNHSGTAPINLTGNELGQIIIGNAGQNYLFGGGGADALQGLGGDDFLYVDANDPILELAGGGYDNALASESYTLNAGAHVEVLSTTNHGGTAAIHLTGNEIGQIVIGNGAGNVLRGGGGADTLIGLGGDDTLFVDADDSVREDAGGGYDNVLASQSFTLGAGAHVEVLSTINHGGTAAIGLTGNEFGQVVIGNAGANMLNGGLGGDVLQGLGGADTFAFTTALGSGNVDIILDFAGGSDRIALENGLFTGLAEGALPPGAFVTGTAAQDADDRIIYDNATGRLYFDADGNGAGAAVQFATLQGAPALTAGDFTVI